MTFVFNIWNDIIFLQIMYLSLSYAKKKKNIKDLE